MTGIVVWLTGLPSSGKSTLARHLLAALRHRGRAAALLDGDEVRAALVPAPGYTPEARDAFYATLGRLAALLARQELVAIVAATAHRRAYRAEARALAPRFLEVYLDVSADECRKRDAKGLYARAAKGEAKDVPGAGVDYELSAEADLVASGGEDAGALDAILRLLEAR